MCCFSLIFIWLPVTWNNEEYILIIEKTWLRKWNFKMKFQYDCPPSNYILRGYRDPLVLLQHRLQIIKAFSHGPQRQEFCVEGIWALQTQRLLKNADDIVTSKTLKSWNLSFPAQLPQLDRPEPPKQGYAWSVAVSHRFQWDSGTSRKHPAKSQNLQQEQNNVLITSQNF